MYRINYLLIVCMPVVLIFQGYYIAAALLIFTRSYDCEYYQFSVPRHGAAIRYPAQLKISDLEQICVYWLLCIFFVPTKA